MTFQLRADESVRKGIRRIARKEIDKARDDLTGQIQPLDEVVHAARKRFKKLRAVMRLVRDSLGGKVYRRENTAFRDAGRPLSEVRDAHALVLALDKLGEGREQEVSPTTWSIVRQALQQREQEVNQEVLEGRGTLDEVLASLEDARQRIKGWPLVHDGFSVLRTGLKRAYRRGLRAFAFAGPEPTDEKLHECRKRVQDLRHHLDLLRPVRPGVLGELADQAHALSDRLGDDHDLAVLRHLLTTFPEPLGTDGQALLPLIDRRREELRQEARAIGERVYRDSPRDFIRRVSAYWHLWYWENEVARWDGAKVEERKESVP